MRFAFTLSILFAALVCSCKKAPQISDVSTRKSDRPQILVTNYPLAYFAERIGSTEVDVVFPAPKDQDPAFWQPNDQQITAYQQADLILMNGATYSKWAEKVTLPESKMVDTSSGFSAQFIEVKDAVTHSHGKDGTHSHNGIAFTTWLDFDQALLQADAICAALQKLKPESIEMFALNFDLLKRELLELDARMQAVGKKLADRPIMASHPIYQYWARRYHINLKHVLWEPEEVPTDAQMNDLKGILASHPAKTFVWEGEPAKESVEKIKALGLSSVVFDPCANVPEKGTWLDVMRANVKAMEAVE